MRQPQQRQDQLKFQNKKINDQTKTIEERQKRISEWIEQQQNPRHNQQQ